MVVSFKRQLPAFFGFDVSVARASLGSHAHLRAVSFEYLRSNAKRLPYRADRRLREVHRRDAAVL
jgi:hypothetical protein